jgi:hypothetical protein
MTDADIWLWLRRRPLLEANIGNNLEIPTPQPNSTTDLHQNMKIKHNPLSKKYILIYSSTCSIALKFTDRAFQSPIGNDARNHRGGNPGERQNTKKKRKNCILGYFYSKLGFFIVQLLLAMTLTSVYRKPYSASSFRFYCGKNYLFSSASSHNKIPHCSHRCR